MCVLFTSFGSSGSSTKQIAASNGDVAGGKDDTLNIFSLASGHLYERLLRFAASTLQYIIISRRYAYDKLFRLAANRI